ncbi:MAG: multiheme c-type cytochrome [Gammaproteobacteria bacterium]|nr:multiheme c-type cytochrome [Gammaproteobacteria bacterium]
MNYKFLKISLLVILYISLPLTTVLASSQNITLIYSGNLDGELEPCGCSEGGDKGGIKRRVKKVDELRKEQPDLILFSSGGLLVSEMPQDKLKSQFILSGLEELNYDAIGVQWQDLAYGLPFLKETFNTFIASNWENESLQKSVAVERGKQIVEIFNWIDPNSEKSKGMMGDNPVSHDTTDIAQQLKQAKAKKHITILSTTLPLDSAEKLFPLDNIDILVIEAAYEIINEPIKKGNTLVLQPGSRGMRLGKLDLQINEQGNIENYIHKVIALPVDVGDAPRMEAWYKAYNDKVREEYEARVAARKAMTTGQSPYAGEKVCESCHAKEHEKWFESPHAEAFFKLMDVGKSFDPNCIGCHTVGFEKEGGYLDYMLTKDLANVQCENCHGAAKAHADSGGAKPVANKGWKPEQMCQQCHIQKHSPDFKFDTYWPRIKH